MQGSEKRFALGADGLRCSAGRRGIALLALSVLLAACNGDNRPTSNISPASQHAGATLAFESIDGPPRPIFQKLVDSLSAEAAARQVTIVSREAKPHYRVRGYLAMHVENGRTRVGWVWDIYDSQNERAFRIAGEEAGARAGGDPWLAADSEMVRRIARVSMEQIVAFLGNGGVSPTRPSPPDTGPAIAGTRNPESLAFASER